MEQGNSASSRPLSHAYLLIAEPDAGYAEARAIAQAMVCSAPEGTPRPCGLCRDCRKAEKGIHPDILTVERLTDDKGKPKREIYVDQIRDIVADSVVMPNEAERKVYILRDADSMNAAAQMLLADMLCGRLPDRKLPRAELLRLVALMRTAETYLRFNVSTKHLLGLLAVDGVRRDAEESYYGI